MLVVTSVEISQFGYNQPYFCTSVIESLRKTKGTERMTLQLGDRNRKLFLEAVIY